MLFALCALVLAMGSLTIILAALWRAPESYETEQGLIIRVAPVHSTPPVEARFSAKRTILHHWCRRVVKAFLLIEKATQHP